MRERTSAMHVVLIDDDASSLRSMSALLRAHGYEVSSHATAESFLSTPLPSDRACLLLDIRMPGLSGLDLQEQLLARPQRLPVIILTGHGDIAAAVRAMRAGAIDFIEKPAPVDQLLDALRLAESMVGVGSRPASPAPRDVAQRLARLTEREREVVDHMLLGETNKQIAEELGISLRTVEVHRSRIRRKLEIRGLADLIRMLR